MISRYASATILRARDHDAGEQHDQRQRPAGRRPEQHDALQDGVGLGARRGGRGHAPAAGSRGCSRCAAAIRNAQVRCRLVGLAKLELLAAARAVPFRPRRAPDARAGRRLRSSADRVCMALAAVALIAPASASRGAGGRRAARPPLPIRRAPTLHAHRSSPASRRAGRPAPRGVNSAIPGITVASSAILMSATRTPSIMTSIMLHVRVVGMMAEQRSHPARRMRSRARAERDRQHEDDLQRRRDDRGEEHQHRDDLAGRRARAARRRRTRWWRPGGRPRSRPSMGTELAIT